MFFKIVLMMPRIPSPSMRAILAENVRAFRKEHGLSQEELADRSGMFRTYMSRIESGVANPTVTMLYAVADALEVRVQELFDDPKEAPGRVRSKKPISRGRVDR